MANDTTRKLLIACDSELSAIAHGRPPSDKATLMDLAYRCRGIYDSAPAPSDVKGEEPVRIEVSPDELAALREAKERMDSRASLTPLTDPSVRGVLVACSYEDMDAIKWVHRPDRIPVGPLKLRPASEFGVAESSDLQAERDQLDVMCHEGAARCERLGERIKELEAERQLSPSVEEALSAINRALLFFRQGDQSGCDGMNEREISLASTAGIKLIRNAFGTEQSMHSAWRKRATESESDAERLRKAIGEALQKMNHNPVVTPILQAALSPSPAAASGEKYADSLYVEAMTDAIKRATSAPAAESEGGR